MKTTKQRLEYYLSYKGLRKATFEQSIGAAQGFVNNIGKSIGGAYVEKISRIYPDLSIGWLLSGEGEMLKQVPSNVQIGDGNTNHQSNNSNSSNSNITNEDGGTINVSGNCDLSKLLEAVTASQETISRLSEQQDRLISIIDKLTNK